MIPEEVIQKVKDENNIVDVVSEFVRLKKSGSNYVGLCPFHSEKTGSFMVSPEKQIFKCFGCGEAGNVLTFIMKIKNISFVEAVKVLADRVNIIIDAKDSSGKKDDNNKLYRLNIEAARYFFSNLNYSNEAQKYLNSRGINRKTIRNFGLGFSYNRWDGILKYLQSKGYTELDLLKCGLIIRSDKGTYYDRFRNRIMFPVFDYKGRIIGFGGRVLDESKPKYLNSPDSAIFKKGTNLYGLNFTIKNIQERTIIIVEGYMDCISLHQFGITNVVASLGTALTKEQAKLLKRYADDVIISYDADIAGQVATLRGLEILRKEGFNVKVLTVPEGKDPDEFVRNNGKESFLRLVEKSIPLIDYRIKRAFEGKNLKNQNELIHYINEVVEIIADLDPVEKDVYIKKASEQTSVSEQSIYDALSRKMQNNVNNLQQMNIDMDFGQKLYLEPAYVKAERNLLKLMLSNNKSYEYVTCRILEKDFNNESHKKLFNLIIDNYCEDKEKLISLISNACKEYEISKSWINICDMDDIYIQLDNFRLVDDYIKEIKKYKLEESKKHIMKKIKEYERNGLIKESLELAQDVVEIKKELSKLK